MDPFFWFSLLLTYLPITESNGNCLNQPVNEMKQNIGQDAFLPCIATASCLDEDMRYEWFVFKKHNRHPLSVQFGSSPRFTLDRASLHITSLNVNDSGIYYCAAAGTGRPVSGKQYVGLGTTLTVRAQDYPMVKYILLWSAFVLLAIYSLVILTLILSKKLGYNLISSREMCKTDKNNSANKETTKTQFRNVLQEMYNRKNLQRDAQTAGRNLSQAQAASVDFNSSNDDIYQNV